MKLRLRRPSRGALGWMAAVAAAAAFQVWVQHRTTDLGYELATLSQLRARLAREKGELEGELASITSPRALDQAARMRLGLRSPRAGEIVRMP